MTADNESLSATHPPHAEPVVSVEARAKEHYEYMQGRWTADFLPWDDLPSSERDDHLAAMRAADALTPAPVQPDGGASVMASVERLTDLMSRRTKDGKRIPRSAWLEASALLTPPLVQHLLALAAVPAPGGAERREEIARISGLGLLLANMLSAHEVNTGEELEPDDDALRNAWVAELNEAQAALPTNAVPGQAGDGEVDELQRQLQEARDGARHQGEHILRLSREIEEANADRDDLESAWEATGYLSNRGKVTLAEQISAINAEIEKLASRLSTPDQSPTPPAEPVQVAGEVEEARKTAHALYAEVMSLRTECEGLRLAARQSAAPAAGMVDDALPWTDLKVAFSVEDPEPVWNAQRAGNLDLPSGWSLNETDCSGARCVAIFRVEGRVLPADGRRILSALSKLDATT